MAVKTKVAVAVRNLIERNCLVSVPAEMSVPWIVLPSLCARVRKSAVQFSSLKSVDARLAALEKFSLLAILVSGSHRMESNFQDKSCL